MRLGDYDDPGISLAPTTRATARWLGAQAGITVPSAAEVRDRACDERDRRVSDAVLRGRGQGRRDDRLDMATRGAAHRRPVRPVPVAQSDDGLHGALPQYTAGDLL